MKSGGALLREKDVSSRDGCMVTAIVLTRGNATQDIQAEKKDVLATCVSIST